MGNLNCKCVPKTCLCSCCTKYCEPEAKEEIKLNPLVLPPIIDETGEFTFVDFIKDFIDQTNLNQIA